MQQAQTIVHDHPEPRSPERVVVLGSSGFLGRHLVQRLEQVGIETAAPASADLDLSSPRAASLLADLLRPTDAVVFLAATKLGLRLDEDGFVDNVAMGAAVCNAVRNRSCAHVVYMSSDAVYPFTNSAIREDAPTASTSLYAVMHLARETMLRNLNGPPLAILRVTQVYGAGDPHGAYGPRRMVRSALSEGRIVLYGEGQETRDHIHVDDVSSIMSEVLMRRSHGLVNIATGRSTSFAALADLVAQGCGGSIRIEHDPPRMPVLHRQFDTEALRAAFPGRPGIALESGIEILIEQERKAQSTGTSARHTGGVHSRHGHNGAGLDGQSEVHDAKRLSAPAVGSASERDRSQ